MSVTTTQALLDDVWRVTRSHGNAKKRPGVSGQTVGTLYSRSDAIFYSPLDPDSHMSIVQQAARCRANQDTYKILNALVTPIRDVSARVQEAAARLEHRQCSC